MKNKYILNHNVIFSPDENKLTPVGPRGSEVILHTPVSRFLLLLILRNGDTVEQEEIYKEVWEKHGQRVTANTLYQNVSLLRKSLKKAGMHTPAIKTHPKSGFSFRGYVQLIDEDEHTKVAETAPPSFIVDEADVKTEYSEKGELIGLHAQMDSSASSSPRTQVKKIALMTIIVIIAVVVATYAYQRLMADRKQFVITQEIVSRVNGCPVYIDQENKGVDLSKVLSYVREKLPRCPADNFIYLTKNPFQEQVVVIICDSSNQDTKCHILFRLPDYLFPQM